MNRAEIKEKTFNFVSPLNKRNSTNRIIIHHTGGADIDAYAEQIHQWHLDADYAGIGYHFVIRKNGDIERGRPIWAVGSHAYGANYDSIGIHLSGDFTYNSPTSEQIESLALLIANLCAEYHISIDRKHIIGHRETIATDCPGNVLFNLLDIIVGKALWYRYQTPDIIDTPAEPPVKTAKKFGMLSEHFSENEFRCKCCGGLKVNQKLIDLLERLRWNIGGYPLYINSGYRCPKHNEEVDGVANSQHCFGNAADVACPEQLSFGQFKWYVEQLPFDGIGFYPDADFIHVDVRDGGRGAKIYWEG